MKKIKNIKKNTKKYNSFLLLLFSSLLLSSLIFSFYYFGLFSNINNKINDGFYGGKEPLSNIIILSIDDKSINQIGRWPWNRTVFSEILDKLNSKNIGIVGMDVGFFEISSLQEDLSLENSLNQTKKIVLGMEYTSFDKKGNSIFGKDKLLPIFDSPNLKVGYVNINLDSDGIARSVNPDIKGGYSSFDLSVYETYFNKPFNRSKLKNKERFLINFIGSPHFFKECSVVDFLDDNCEDINFKNKIVLIGATAKDLHDDFLVPTSHGEKMAGVEVHANILQTLILKNELSKIPNIFLFFIMLLTSLSIGVVSFKKGLIKSLAFSIFLFLFYIIFSIFVFEKYNIILNLFYIHLIVLLTFVFDVLIKYLTEKRKKDVIHSLFGKYLNPTVVNELMKDDSKLKLGGEQKKITILFSDIAKFTTLSEQMSPKQVVDFLNKYLNKMSEVVFNNQGIIDKYIGDAIMAFWGAPIEQKNQVELACKTALEMLALKKQIQKETKIKNLNFRIGINYGDAIVGNLGSSKKMNYTIIGDSVNVASRLEGINKEFKTNIIVSQSVYEKVKTKFVFKYLGEVKVKGKKQKIKIYELIKNK